MSAQLDVKNLNQIIKICGSRGVAGCIEQALVRAPTPLDVAARLREQGSEQRLRGLQMLAVSGRCRGGAVGHAGSHSAGPLAGGSACITGILGVRPRRRALSGVVVGGGAAQRSRPPDGRDARHRFAVGYAAGADPRAGRDRVSPCQAARCQVAAATRVRPACGVTEGRDGLRPSRPSRRAPSRAGVRRWRVR